MVADGSQITGLDHPIVAELALHIGEVLHGVRGLVAIGIEVGIGRGQLRHGPASAGHRVAVKQIRHADATAILA